MKRLSNLRRARGFSLIELLISVVIGMLALMFATRLVAGGERGRQDALGGSDAMQNGMLAMFSIRGDAEQAGYGLNDPLVVGCHTHFSDTVGYTLPEATRSGATITPLGAAMIEAGATSADGDAPDRISLFAGTSLTGTGTLRLNADYVSGTPLVVDRVPYGFRTDDVVVLAPEKMGGDCALAQISSNPSDLGAPPAAQTVAVDAGVTRRFNRANLDAAFKGGVARMFNLGPASALSFHTWSVNDGFLQLRATNLSGAEKDPSTVLDNIVSIKAQYGFDKRLGGAFTPGDGVVIDEWSGSMIDADTDGVVGSAEDYQRISALRIAVVARSKSPQRPAAGQECTAWNEGTDWTTLPTVFTTKEPNSTAAVPISVKVAVTGDPVDWKCYKYRVFETVVPIRNAAWRP